MLTLNGGLPISLVFHAVRKRMGRSKSTPSQPSRPGGGNFSELAERWDVIKVWWLAARPATLGVSVAPVLAGTALAVYEGSRRPWAAAGALIVALAMQVGVNYANDYSDFIRGVDSPQRVGPRRVAASGLVPPTQVRLAAGIAFAWAAVTGTILSLTTDPRLLILGVLGVLAGCLYTGGPRPYGYIGLGELSVFLFFGLLATTGTVYVQLSALPLAAWLIGISMGLLACAVLALNNLRDLASDAEAGKRTLAVLLGSQGTRWLIGALLAGALLPPVLAVAYARVPVLAVLPLTTAPMMLRLYRATGTADPRMLIRALRQATLIEGWFALLWAFGLLIGEAIHGREV
jgi:1,4-dihydroxy-2-naphthoate polyprenyltransferase